MMILPPEQSNAKIAMSDLMWLRTSGAIVFGTQVINLSDIPLEVICLLIVFQERKNSSTTLTFGMISRGIGAIRKISQTTMITAKASNGVVVEEKEKMKGARSRSINRSQTALFPPCFQDRRREKEGPRKYSQAPRNKKAPRVFRCLTRL